MSDIDWDKVDWENITTCNMVSSSRADGTTWVNPNGSTAITGTYTYPGTVVDEQDARVIKAPPPNMATVLAEIAKVVKKKGDISQIRDILDKYKLKIVDHDGEVIYDADWDTKLKTKNL